MVMDLWLALKLWVALRRRFGAVEWDCTIHRGGLWACLHRGRNSDLWVAIRTRFGARIEDGVHVGVRVRVRFRVTIKNGVDVGVGIIKHWS